MLNNPLAIQLNGHKKQPHERRAGGGHDLNDIAPGLNDRNSSGTRVQVRLRQSQKKAAR
jgi:hypothetical protein